MGVPAVRFKFRAGGYKRWNSIACERAGPALLASAEASSVIAVPGVATRPRPVERRGTPVPAFRIVSKIAGKLMKVQAKLRYPAAGFALVCFQPPKL